MRGSVGAQQVDNYAQAVERPPAPAHLGRLLAAYRQRAGLSQTDLARRVGMDVSYINRVERGARRHAPLSFVARVAASLDLAPGEANALVLSAGLLPPELQRVDPLEPAVHAVLQALAQFERASPAARDHFRALVRHAAELLALSSQVDTAEPAGPPPSGEVPASATPRPPPAGGVAPRGR